MPSAIHMIAYSRLLILTWLITWVAIGPLFATYLPDLPDTSDGSASLQGTRRGHFHLSNHVSNFVDINVALLEEDDKSKKRNVGQEKSSVTLVSYPIDRPFQRNLISESLPIHPRLLLLSAPQGPRAPPSSISL